MSQFLQLFNLIQKIRAQKQFVECLLLQTHRVIIQNAGGVIYYPSNLLDPFFYFYQDLLRCRVLTSGIFETRFQVDKVNFQ